MDNAGENKLLQQYCNQNNITAEYAPLDTSKINESKERAFAIRWEKAKILM